MMMMMMMMLIAHNGSVAEALVDATGVKQDRLFAPTLTIRILRLATAVSMPDLAGLNDVTDGISSCVTIGGNGSGELPPVSYLATETESRRSKDHFQVLKN
ncbi:unnamed protein product [Dibothriocephalus latus]|uniref:Secreted protein n=1 Tax=Dibothriocephalus latus TaxID=60516 RepID=A0A3P7PKI0_DIBLA|nr:unnamed protein product [Dibothriocephalus latus]